MFWQIRCWLISLRPEALFPGKFDFRIDFWGANPRSCLLSDYVIALQLRIAHLFERLHFATQNRVNRICWSIERLRLAYYLKRLDSAIEKGYKTLRNQDGMADIEAITITGCFLFVMIISTLAICNAGGVDSNTLAEAQAEICEELCEMDYRNGLDNVVQYQRCVSMCSQ